ncbi:MAG: UDP-N-acetylmuramate dehydrogenase [Acidimicrobiia bacterium]|nr:UDP-N-acetylmuramate dehydrogenase [Acidimicrobiia bacterium]
MTPDPEVPMRSLADELGRRLPGRVERDAPSAGLVTFRCGGPFAVLVRASGSPICWGWRSLWRVRRRSRCWSWVGARIYWWPTTGSPASPCSSTLVSRASRRTRPAAPSAGGAAALPVLARRAASAGLAGLEFYVGIPGSVGGAVRMNAGGHGSETRDVLTEVRVVDLSSGASARRAAADLDLGYRSSALRDGEVVVEASFATTRDDPDECTRRIDEVVRWRREHQPGGANAGSVFRNPPGDSAGRLIDACGLRGRTVGGVRVSEKHANFFVASPGATAADVRDLVAEVRAAVEAGAGVRLECELRMVGFGESAEVQQ